MFQATFLQHIERLQQELEAKTSLIVTKNGRSAQLERDRVGHGVCVRVCVCDLCVCDSHLPFSITRNIPFCSNSYSLFK